MEIIFTFGSYLLFFWCVHYFWELHKHRKRDKKRTLEKWYFIHKSFSEKVKSVHKDKDKSYMTYD